MSGLSDRNSVTESVSDTEVFAEELTMCHNFLGLSQSMHGSVVFMEPFSTHFIATTLVLLASLYAAEWPSEGASFTAQHRAFSFGWVTCASGPYTRAC